MHTKKPQLSGRGPLLLEFSDSVDRLRFSVSGVKRLLGSRSTGSAPGERSLSSVYKKGRAGALPGAHSSSCAPGYMEHQLHVLKQGELELSHPRCGASAPRSRQALPGRLGWMCVQPGIYLGTGFKFQQCLAECLKLFYLKGFYLSLLGFA